MTDEASSDQPAARRLDDQLCFALYAATNSVLRAYRPLLHDIGLTYTQYILLMVLWEADDITVGELGERLALPVNSLVPVLDRLERAQLLERRRSKIDRRNVQVLLTDAGRALEPRAAEVQHQVQCRTQLDPEAVAALRDELHQLTDALTRGTA